MISQLPDHFFTRDGALYDTRRQEWSSAPPLRPVYDRHFSTIETTAQFKALPGGQLWRHNVAGDLPHDPETGIISGEFMEKLVKSNKGRNGFTYTHHDIEKMQRYFAL